MQSKYNYFFYRLNLENEEFDDDNTLTPKKKVTLRRSHTENEMPQSIAKLQAQLKENGESDWKKRVSLNNNATDELKLLKEKNRYNVSYILHLALS